MRSAAVQLTTISELGVVSQKDGLTAIASDPSVAALLESGAPLPAPATEAVRRLLGTPNAQTVIRFEAPDGTLRLQLPPDRGLGGMVLGEFPDEPTIGPMFLTPEGLAFQSGIRVRRQGEALGTIRVIRWTGAATANRRITANLLGDAALLMVGNVGGDRWTRGVKVARADATSDGRYERDGMEWLTFTLPVKGTPWENIIEVPVTSVLAPVRSLLVPLILGGTVITILASFVGWQVSRSITAPLEALTTAAEAISAGRRHVHVPHVATTDEIGRLSRSFRTMAAAIDQVQTHLEETLDARTVELRTAVERLRAAHDEFQQNAQLVSSGVGHELRNPLGVMNSVVFLLDGLPESSPKIKDYARLLREQIELSQRIITGLLDRSRASSRLVVSDVNPAELVDELILVTGLPDTIRLRRTDVSPVATVLVDRDGVWQALWNLVTNAVQAMQASATGTGELRIGARTCDGRLRISVGDTGPGIPSEAIDRVFDPMFTTKPSGVGLGLSISRTFARSVGGDLYVEDTGSHGTTFVLDIPAPVTSVTTAEARASG